MLRAIIQAGVVIIALTSAAMAQGIPMNLPLQQDKPELTPEQKAKQEAYDNAYKKAISKIPEHQNSDPWGDIRPTQPAGSKHKLGQQTR